MTRPASAVGHAGYIRTLSGAVFAALVLTAAPQLAVAADTAEAAQSDAGRKLFIKHCKSCHDVEAGQDRKIAPNLYGVFGRRAGSLPNFRYSAAMRDSGIVWDDETMSALIHDPKAVVPKSRHFFRGLAKRSDVQSLLVYLKEAAR